MMSTASEAGAARGKTANGLALVREGAKTSPAGTTVVLADPHVLFRMGMRQLLPSLGSAVEVIEADSIEALVGSLERADLLLVDPTGPGMGGLGALHEIRASRPDLPIVVVSGSEDRAAVDRALSLGARGYVTKTTPSELTLAALRLVLSGGSYVPATYLSRQAPVAASTAAAAGASSLTPRQREVLELLARGCPNKEIAQRLGMAVGTVKIHMTAILRALEVKNRTQAVLAAMSMGYGRGQEVAERVA
jgi:DNA-binding NarL/FixJ family response regulator